MSVADLNSANSYTRTHLVVSVAVCAQEKRSTDVRTNWQAP